MDRDYTYTSCVHGTRTHIDYFLTLVTLLSRVTDAAILPKSVSDHDAIQIGLDLGILKPPIGQWRMKMSRYKQPKDKQHLKDILNTYL